MRQKRILAQGVWYEIRSQINNREQILSLPRAAALFSGVFRETTLRFAFEVRGLRFEADQLRFYIKPEDGLELPAIMQWLKQTFAQRYNALTGRTGHIWGDRYWSAILEGEVPAEVGMEAGLGAGAGHRARPRRRKRDRNPRFSAISLAPRLPAPG
ncbi:MAG: transposase [Treponema sp.]|jgi:REP element-mobilizing transposase RayT|nr:transposase [Treponema sp.]